MGGVPKFSTSGITGFFSGKKTQGASSANPSDPAKNPKGTVKNGKAPSTGSGTGEEMGNYVLASTTETGTQGRPKAPGAINGGFFPKKPDWPAQYPSVVIGVGDIKKAMQKITKSGGKVLGEPMEIPGVGHYVSFTDTEGNRVSILQPAPMGKPANAKSATRKKAVARKKKK